MGLKRISLLTSGILLMIFPFVVEKEELHTLVVDTKEIIGEAVWKVEEEVSTPSTPMGYLTIPTISLHQPWYSLSSEENTVDKHVEQIKSNLPNVERGNFILAAHAGNSSVSYFQNIHLLKKGDVIFVTYQGKTYSYEVTDFYEVLKSEFEVIRDCSKTTLTLVTCVTRTNRRFVLIATQV